MRKNLISAPAQNNLSANQRWFNLESMAQVEFSAEQAENPVENIFTSETHSIWRASHPGKQTVRLLFDSPQDINCIRVVFREEEQSRTQEFLLCYSTDGGKSYQEILRQQYNFSPPDTCLQVEEYGVQLEKVTTLELTIIPDIGGGNAHASMVQWQIA
jgi:hypothetical protein